jgi:excisionase family DNA binding protein
VSDHTLLTGKEAAKVLGMSESSFYRLARPKLPTIKLGAGMVRFDPADLRALIEGSKQPATADA